MSSIDKQLHADAEEIAAAIGKSSRTVNRMANDENWPAVEGKSRGRNKKKWFVIKQLPAEICAAVIGQRIELRETVAIAEVAAEVATVAPAEQALAVSVPTLEVLSQAQRDIHRARKLVVEFIQSGTGPVSKRIVALNQGYADKTLLPIMLNAFETAWEKRRDHTVLSAKTLENWQNDFKQRGHYAPMKKQKDRSVKCWHALANALKKRPQGSCNRWVAAQLEQQYGDLAPGYDRLCFYFREVASQGDLLSGRYSGSQLRALTFYQHRTSDGLAPASLIHADGWNTHFSAPHPVTGEFVTYEVWHFHDVATRFVSKPGIGLTENAGVIAKGLENCVRELGVMATIQTDSTKVVRGNDKFTKSIESIEERLGFTWTHPAEVGNSQANGIAENFNTSYLDKRSRELATYQNKKSMDDLSYKRVKKLTSAMVKAASKQDLVERDRLKREIQKVGKGYVFDSYEDAKALINQWFDDYNDRPHSALPKIVDPSNGKKRHQTPREALQWHLEQGWQPFALDEHELIDAFRPHVIKKVTRETVSPWGGLRYANHEALPHWNGKEVMVAFDMDDNSQVWIKDLKGGLICSAELVNAVPYLTPTAQQDAEEKRLKQGLARLDKKRETKLAQHGGDIIEGEALIKVPHLPSESLEPIELKRVVFDADNTPAKPLKVLMMEVEERPEDQPLSYLETIRKFQADDQQAAGNE